MDGTLYYVHQDHVGSTVALSDAAGGEVGRVQYNPYGEVLTSTLPVTLTDRLFTGAQFDGTIGLYQMGARWYDPALGRWIQADTIVPNPTNPQDLNRYTYVRNNPLRYTDPSGHYVLLEDETGAYGEFSVRILPGGEIRILSGGRWFRNYVEVAFANYELSGRRTALPEIGGAFGPTIRGPIINALTGLGYRSSATSGVAEVWMDPLLVVGLAQLAGQATEDAAGAAGALVDKLGTKVTHGRVRYEHKVEQLRQGNKLIDAGADEVRYNKSLVLPDGTTDSSIRPDVQGLRDGKPFKLPDDRWSVVEIAGPESRGARELRNKVERYPSDFQPLQVRWEE